MSAPAIIRQADAERIFNAARKAGLKPKRIRVTAGEIDIFFDGDGASHAASPNPWDEMETR